MESAGISLLWCDIVAGVVGGAAGGKYFGDSFEAIGEELYKTTLGR